MRKTMRVLLVGFMLCGVVNAANSVEIRAFPSCGEWVAERAKDATASIASRFWLLGYISGLASGTGKNILVGTDNDSIYLWMDNYCRANPLNQVSSGGDALYFELKKKKGIK